MADITVSIAHFFAGLILIYRTWVIWERNYHVVIVPLLCTTASLSEQYRAASLL